jgi:hypothetical protein
MSPNHLLYNHYMQNSSAQIVPNFVMLEASYDLDLSRLNQNVTLFLARGQWCRQTLSYGRRQAVVWYYYQYHISIL